MSDTTKHADMPNVDLEKQDGLLVRAADGRVFFLPKAEIAKTQLHGEAATAAENLLDKVGLTPPIQPEQIDNCANLLRWLMSNDPFTQNWRENSVWWMNEC
jgi:hypothetical protein